MFCLAFLVGVLRGVIYSIHRQAGVLERDEPTPEHSVP